MEDYYLRAGSICTINSLITTNTNENTFNLLLNIYNIALNKVYNELNFVKQKANEFLGYDIVNNITKRIKTKESIIKKMQKKNYQLDYIAMCNNINDIAGIRVICPVKDNIYQMIDIISKIKDIKIIERKDYLTKPKKSGYIGYHLIIETYINFRNKVIPVKVEIQIRTSAMDAWSINEHKLKYKNSKNKISFIDSKKLIVYAKIINFIDNRLNRIYQRQNKL